MKLLLDQNISFRVVEKISSVFSEACQVRALGLENSSDQDIWQFAKKNHFTIDIAQLLLGKAESIKAFITHADYSQIACLEIES